MDFVGSIFNVVVATAARLNDTVILLQSAFLCGTRAVEMTFLVIPELTTLQLLLGHVE